MVVLTLEEIEEIIENVAKMYPEAIFSEPTMKKKSPPDCYTAAGCRLACRLVKQRIYDYLMEGME